MRKNIFIDFIFAKKKNKFEQFELFLIDDDVLRLAMWCVNVL